MNDSITDVPGIKVGHATDFDALTGCSVILCEDGAVGGVDQRGGAPGTRETDLLHPLHLVQKVHAITLAGGSAYGLDAASGVMRFLEDQEIGFNTGVARVPIVPAAILYDLWIGDPKIRPDAEMGYKACQNASADMGIQGNIGAGTGCTVGKILGPKQSMKAGIGTSSIEVGGGVIIGAIIAVNAWGDVIDPQNDEIIAGARSTKLGPFNFGEPGYFADTMQTMKTLVGRSSLGLSGRTNTVIGVVATNARLDKNGANKVAQMAHNGIARTISPSHTMLDGDTLFCIGTGKKKANINVVGAYASVVVSTAILHAVRSAKSAGGLPGLADQ